MSCIPPITPKANAESDQSGKQIVWLSYVVEKASSPSSENIKLLRKLAEECPFKQEDTSPEVRDVVQSLNAVIAPRGSFDPELSHKAQKVLDTLRS